MAEEVPQRLLAKLALIVAVHHPFGRPAQAGLLHRGAKTLIALTDAHQFVRAADESDMTMPGGDQFFGGDAPALNVISKHFWNLTPGNIFIQQDNAFVTLDLLAQQAVIGAVCGEQQAVYLAGIQPADELALFFRVVAGDTQHQAVAAGRSGLFGSVGQLGKEGVGNVGEHQAKRLAAAFAQTARQAIPAIVQFANGGFDTVDGVLRQHNTVVHIARQGRFRQPRQLCHIR